MIITEWDKGLACSSIIEVIFNVQYVFYLNRMNFSKFYQCTSPYAISRILVGTEKLILYLSLRWHEMCHKIGSRQYHFFFFKILHIWEVKKKNFYILESRMNILFTLLWSSFVFSLSTLMVDVLFFELLCDYYYHGNLVALFFKLSLNVNN